MRHMSGSSPSPVLLYFLLHIWYANCLKMKLFSLSSVDSVELFSSVLIIYLQLLLTALKSQLLMWQKDELMLCFECIESSYEMRWARRSYGQFSITSNEGDLTSCCYVDSCSQTCYRYGKNITACNLNLVFNFVVFFCWTFCCIEISIRRLFM